MADLRGPHCGSVHIIVGEPETDVCNTIGCHCIMDRLIEPEAGAAIRKAFYGHDHKVGATVTAETP